VSEAVGVSAPARTAIAQACSEQNLATATTNELLGLPTAISITGTYVTSVTAEGVNATSGTVTILMKQIGSAVAATDTIIYTGTCGAGGVTWALTGSTVAAKYLPKV